MNFLSTLLIIKILITVIFVALPLFLAPKPLLEKIFQVQASHSGLFKLYGVAICALLAGYSYGLYLASIQQFPTGAVIMGMVSNLGAAAILLRLPKTSNTITNWLTIISGLVFGAIGVGLAIAMLFQDWSLALPVGAELQFT